MLEAVTLSPSAEDGIPRLELTVITPASDAALPGVEILPGVAAAGTPPEGMLVRGPRRVVDPTTLDETPPPEPAPTVEVAPVVDAPPVAEPAPRERELTKRMFGSDAITLVPAVPVAKPAAARRELGPGTWVAMGVVTLGVAGTLGYVLWDRSVPPPPPHPEKIVVVERPRPEPAPAAVSPAPPSPSPSPSPAAIPSPAALPLAAAVVAEKSEKTSAPEPERAADSDPEPDPPAPEPVTALGIKVVGTTQGMQFYRLADPPGLAINLPHGTPVAKPRPPAGGVFKKVAVVRKGAGSQVRLYFFTDQNTDVTSDGNGLRVVVRGKRKP
jgi:hypothetical protein